MARWTPKPAASRSTVGLAVALESRPIPVVAKPSVSTTTSRAGQRKSTRCPSDQDIDLREWEAGPRDTAPGSPPRERRTRVQLRADRLPSATRRNRANPLLSTAARNKTLEHRNQYRTSTLTRSYRPQPTRAPVVLLSRRACHVEQRSLHRRPPECLAHGSRAPTGGQRAGLMHSNLRMAMPLMPRRTGAAPQWVPAIGA